MKNIAIVNSVHDRSTGKIATGLLDYLNTKGYNTTLYYGHGELVNRDDHYRIDRVYEHYYHALMCRITGIQGAYSINATKRLLKQFDEKKVDTIYGIGLHGYYLNEKMFYDYIIKNNISFIYIMTEEYPFLGKCGYSNGCTNFLSGCGNCPQIKEYPKSLFLDRTAEMFKIKQNAYSNFSKAVFVGPEFTIQASKKSPLMKGIRTEIIDEAIDVQFYCPRDTANLRNKLNLSDDLVIIVCIAPLSYERKGVKYYIELAKRFEGNPKYVFVHVGYDSSEKTGLPNNYIPIGYVSDQNTLAEYYSLGDLFVFPSLLDTMPNACLEALSCGTPLLCFDVSGMPYIADETTATFVEAKNVDQMAEVITNINKKTSKTVQVCRNYALNRYDSKKYFQKLMNIALQNEYR